MGLNILSSSLAILFWKLHGNLLHIYLMLLIFCNSFYLAKGGNPSVRGSDVRVDKSLDV